MSDPVTFTSNTPRLGLPLLHVGQVQKEVTLNEALLRADTLLHCVVEGEAAVPPASPAEGQAWIVAASASGIFAGHAGELAHYSGNDWLFTAPVEGLRVYDRTAGQEARYDSAWQRAAAVPAPAGGTTQDAEARAAIAGLVAALVAGGILPGT